LLLEIYPKIIHCIGSSLTITVLVNNNDDIIITIIIILNPKS